MRDASSETERSVVAITRHTVHRHGLYYDRRRRSHRQRYDLSADALLALATGRPASATGNGKKVYGKGNRTLADSRINRSGLRAERCARFPTAAARRRRSVACGLSKPTGLLVLSAPDCHPCDGSLPQLQRQHRHPGHVDILMVSRGDIEANRKKVAEPGLTFPVALQRQSEMSRLYGMFATPIAYLIPTRTGSFSVTSRWRNHPILSLRRASLCSGNDAGVDTRKGGEGSRTLGSRHGTRVAVTTARSETPRPGETS